ncbi:MAG: nucleotidyl transferase AbiEii/AbiGii toxin family protein [Patescibacteria group bacterium]
MVINAKGQIDLHFSALPRATKKALDFLSEQAWLNNSGWYLAGGTALSLNAGLRRSVDLDFFTKEKDFDDRAVLGNFLGNKNWKTSINTKNTIYGELFKAKISFIAYPFFVPKQKMICYGFINILQPLDIAVMKLMAISQRGRKRDFFDLYWCAKNLEPLENLMKRLKVQYPSVAHNYHHILKSLVYFEDAENDPNPEVYFKATWGEVKKFFKKEIPIVTRNLIDL